VGRLCYIASLHSTSSSTSICASLKCPSCNFLILPDDSDLHTEVLLEITLYKISILPSPLPDAVLDRAEERLDRVQV